MTGPVICMKPNCGREWPRDPALEVECPDCRAQIGCRCKRPSGHTVFNHGVHAARDLKAVDPDEIAAGFSFDGKSDSAWRERIGNAVPPDAAEAIAGVMGTTLLLAMTGETFMLSSQPIWVRDIATAIAIDHSGNDPESFC